MTLQQLICFKEVSKELNFTRAGENLFISQASLSHAIQALEDDLGAPLFVRRGGKKISLTKYGEAFLPHVDRILNEVESSKETIMGMIVPNQGEVKIAYSYCNGVNIMPEFQTAFQETSNSDITLRFIVNHSTKSFIEDVLVNGDADLAISAWPFKESKHVASVKLAEQKQYALVSKDCILSKKTSITPDELDGENIILFSGAYGLCDYTKSIFEDAGVDVRYTEGISDWSLIAIEVAANRGVAILPNIGYMDDKIAYIELTGCKNARDIYLLWPKKREISVATKYVKQFFLNYYNV